MASNLKVTTIQSDAIKLSDGTDVISINSGGGVTFTNPPNVTSNTVPSWDNASRPQSPVDNTFGYNTDLNLVEKYLNNNWLTINESEIVTDNLLVHFYPRVTNSVDLSNNKLLDLSGNGYNGDLINGPIIHGGAVKFDGDNDRVTIPAFSWIGYCFDFWIYNRSRILPDVSIGGPSTYQSLITFGGSTPGINLGGWTGSATNEVLSIWTNGPSNLTMSYTRDRIEVGYHNFVFNWNGSTYDIWVDGKKQTVYSGFGSYQGPAVLANYTNTAINLASSFPGTYEFYGSIYEFKMYNGQLTDDQVLQNFNARRKLFSI